jgi:restriction endonuclease S subunit
MTMLPLGEIAEIIRGVSFDGSEAANSARPNHLPILRAGNIGDVLDVEGDVVWVPSRRIAPEQRMRPGDIAICMSSGSASVVGKTAILDRSFDGSVGAFCAVIRPGRHVDGQYLAQWFRAPAFWAWRDGQARGASIQNLRVSQLATLAVPVPSLEVQRSIAAQLTDELATVERTRTASAERLAVVRDLRARVVSQTFDSPVMRPHLSLGSLGTLTDGDWILTADYAPAGVRLLQVGDVGSGAIRLKSSRYISAARARELGCTLLRPGDVLISRMPEPMGRACVLPDLGYPTITAVDVTIFRPDEERLDRDFATYYMNSRQWLSDVASQSSGATRQRISRKNLEQIQVPRPPIDEQRRIVAELRGRLSKIDAATMTLQAELEAIEALPAALLRRAFADVAA